MALGQKTSKHAARLSIWRVARVLKGLKAPTPMHTVKRCCQMRLVVGLQQRGAMSSRCPKVYRVSPTLYRRPNPEASRNVSFQTYSSRINFVGFSAPLIFVLLAGDIHDAMLIIDSSC